MLYIIETLSPSDSQVSIVTDLNGLKFMANLFEESPSIKYFRVSMGGSVLKPVDFGWKGYEKWVVCFYIRG